MARSVYRVVPSGSNWSVTQGNLTLATYYTKDQAIQAGRLFAQMNQPSQLVVHRSDGTFEFEWTYGNDPFPPRG